MTYMIVGVVVAVVLWIALAYNQLVKVRLHVHESWSDIDTELKRNNVVRVRPDGERVADGRHVLVDECVVGRLEERCPGHPLSDSYAGVAPARGRLVGRQGVFYVRAADIEGHCRHVMLLSWGSVRPGAPKRTRAPCAPRPG